MATSNFARDLALRSLPPELREQQVPKQGLTPEQHKAREALAPGALQKIERGIAAEEKADAEKLAELSAHPALHPSMSMSPGGGSDSSYEYAAAMSALQDHQREAAERAQQRQEIKEKYGLGAATDPGHKPGGGSTAAPSGAPGPSRDREAQQPAPQLPDAIAQPPEPERKLRPLEREAIERRAAAEQAARQPAAPADKPKREPPERPTRGDEAKPKHHEIV
ncbi:hypothetical protein GALL_152260 [mine drainage metagenome]|uniref:Uncharacterized protein n=1 Tax=mine drainage metagenome TaxID=410659 RepID=A0A1J5SM65_9ZZZZ